MNNEDEITIETYLQIPHNESAIKEYLISTIEKDELYNTCHILEKVIECIGSKKRNQDITLLQLYNVIEQIELDEEIAVQVLMKFITTATTRVLDIPEDVYTSLVHHLVNLKQFSILTQLLQYHIIPDSEGIAMQLINSSQIEGNLLYCGMDILKRTKKYSLLIEIYLSRGDIQMAVKIANNYKVELPVEKIKKALKEVNDPMLEEQLLLIYPNLKD